LPATVLTLVKAPAPVQPALLGPKAVNVNVPVGAAPPEMVAASLMLGGLTASKTDDVAVVAIVGWALAVALAAAVLSPGALSNVPLTMALFVSTEPAVTPADTVVVMVKVRVDPLVRLFNVQVTVWPAAVQASGATRLVDT
jgi:hypothetical protein